MDFGGMRKWLKKHEESSLMVSSRYQAMINDKECSAVEYRLLLLCGEMDYTTYALEPEEAYTADEVAARKRLFDRICWETKRDTRVEIDPEHAFANGLRYQQEIASVDKV